MSDRTGRYESLDMWRGVACLLVLINHSVFYVSTAAGETGMLASLNSAIATIAQRLWAGVPVFFVISGYCITAATDSHRRSGRPVRLYFLKRFRRIFPPYWFALIGGAALIGAADLLLSGSLSGNGVARPWWFSAWQWTGSTTLTETWRFHLIGGPKGLVLGPAWTLCYEEQFYAVTGILLLLAPRRFFTAAAGVTLAVLAIVAYARASALQIDGFFFDGSWIQFALGILLFAVLAKPVRWPKVLALFVYTGVLMYALSYGRLLLDADKNDGQALLVAAAFSLAALAGHSMDPIVASSPLLAPLRRCGAMCYSLYLVHAPIASVVHGVINWLGFDGRAMSPFLSIPLCAIPSLIVAWQFHVLIERRFMSPITATERRAVELAVAI